jgi:hypothetical protein
MPWFSDRGALGSLVLWCKALSSSSSCRFIPALLRLLWSESERGGACDSSLSALAWNESVLFPEDTMVVVYDLHPAAVRVADIEAAGMRRVVDGAAHRDTQLVRSGQYVPKPVRVDIEGDFIRIGACAAELGREENEQNGAGPKRIVRSGERLRSEQVFIERSEPGRVRAAEGDVVDSENAHGLSAYRAATGPPRLRDGVECAHEATFRGLLHLSWRPRTGTDLTAS